MGCIKVIVSFHSQNTDSAPYLMTDSRKFCIKQANKQTKKLSKLNNPIRSVEIRRIKIFVVIYHFRDQFSKLKFFSFLIFLR